MLQRERVRPRPGGSSIALADFARDLASRPKQQSTELPAQQIAVSGDGGLLVASGLPRRLPRSAEATIGEWKGLCRSTLDELEPEERWFVLSRRGWGANAPKTIRVLFDSDDSVLALSDAGLARLDTSEVASLLQETVPPQFADSATVKVFEDTPDRLAVAVYSPNVSREPRPGDVVQAGVMLKSSVTARFPLAVETVLVRLVCSNGATRHICVDGKNARIRRVKSKGNLEPQRSQVRQRLHAAWSQAETALGEVSEFLNVRMAPRDVEQLLRVQRTRLALTNGAIRAIVNEIEADELRPTGTAWDLFNALSRFATHTAALSDRQRWLLMRTAVEFPQANQACPTCGARV